MKTIKTRCYNCKVGIEFPVGDLGMKSTCPVCGVTIGLVRPAEWYVYPLAGLGAAWALLFIVATIVAVWYWLSHLVLVYTG
jgi:hypothetical protein